MPSSTSWTIMLSHFLFFQFAFSATIKRSPLETGFVTSLGDDNNHHDHHTLYLHTVLAKEATVLPATLLLQKLDANDGLKTILLPNKIYHDLEQNKPSINQNIHLQPHRQSDSSSLGNDVTHLDMPSSCSHRKHHILVWLPGRVYHHAYIPPHLEHHHVVVPSTTRSHVVIHPHRGRGQRPNAVGHHGLDHYGGYGVGVDSGGQGAGHGWEVVGMLYNSF